MAALGSLVDSIKVLRTARAPLAIAALAAIVLSGPPQVREIYRAMAEDISGYAWQLALSLPILCATSIALSAITRELLRKSSIPKGPRLLRRWLPIICASVVPFGLSFGLYFASQETQIGTPPATSLEKLPELGTLIHDLKIARTTLLAEAAVCLLVTTSLLIPNVGFRSVRIRKFFARHELKTSQIALFGAGWLLFFSIFLVTGSQLIGPIGIFLLAVIGISSFAALLTRLGDRLQLPILSGIVLVAILLSVFDLTDNHELKLSDSPAPPLDRASDVFEKWYEQRADRKWYEDRNKPYPVFIVAASGGGLYAAQHAASVLSRLQDQCQNFAQHVFAISGVSGGSLGGALFSNLAKTQAKNEDHADCSTDIKSGVPGPFEQQVNRFMDNDFLSPVLAAALFPDAVQRFFPAITAHFDRARAFESTLEKAWRKSFPDKGKDIWSRPFLEHWDHTKAAPALILNATNVEHGNRIAITPFRIIDWAELGNIVALSNLAEFHRMTELRSDNGSTVKLRDISLATAVSLSARFPWIMPAGRLNLESGTTRIVDGGYVENSGVETVFDLIQYLSRFYEKHSRLRRDMPAVQFFVITITNLQILQNPGGFGLGEILSPIRTMLSARETRSVVALGRLSRFVELCAIYSECGKRVDSASFALNLYDYDLPLGWLLARSTKRIVDLHGGVADRAGKYLGGNNIDDPEKFQRLGAYVSNNDTAVCTVIAMLDAKDRTCN